MKIQAKTLNILWTFVIKDYGDAGSDTFQNRDNQVDKIYNTSGGVEIAGIEFNALDETAPRSEWENDFIMPKDLESWQGGLSSSFLS